MEGTSVETAIFTALRAHRNQTDEDGLPHIVHSLGVMAKVQQEWDVRPVEGYELMEALSVAVLHDVVEDSTIHLDFIRAAFGDRVADAVDALTRRKDEPYRDFIYRAKAHPLARLVKIADLTHNRSRTHKISEKKASWRKKLEYKYGIALRVLNDRSEPTWEGASYEVVQGDRFYIADPNGKRIEIPEKEAKDVKISFRISN